jgi:hypothetical protein
VNLEDTGRLLAVAAAFDARTVDEIDVIAWQEALGDLDFEVARRRVIKYYRENKTPIMPADVLIAQAWWET